MLLPWPLGTAIVRDRTCSEPHHTIALRKPVLRAADERAEELQRDYNAAQAAVMEIEAGREGCR